MTTKTTTEETASTTTETDGIFEGFENAVETKVISVGIYLDRMKKNQLNWNTIYQRKNNVWTTEKQSSLILSMLLGIPLPKIILQERPKTAKADITDGLQRSSAIRDFCLTKTLKLCKLEYMRHLEGLAFNELPEHLQQKILEAPLTIEIIKRSAPPDVAIYTFRMLNRGGAPLNDAEMRNALYQGPATNLLADLAKSEEFLKATNGDIKDKRMADHDVIARALAFLVTPYDKYEEIGSFDAFIGRALDTMNKAPADVIQILEERFKRACSISSELLTPRRAFRKPPTLTKGGKEKKMTFIKALFEATISAIDTLTDDQVEKLRQRKTSIWNRFVDLCNTRDNGPEFLSSFSSGTSDVAKVRMRFATILHDVFEWSLDQDPDPQVEVIKSSTEESTEAPTTEPIKPAKTSAVTRKGPGRPKGKIGSKKGKK